MIGNNSIRLGIIIISIGSFSNICQNFDGRKELIRFEYIWIIFYCSGQSFKSSPEIHVFLRKFVQLVFANFLILDENRVSDFQKTTALTIRMADLSKIRVVFNPSK